MITNTKNLRNIPFLKSTKKTEKNYRFTLEKLCVSKVVYVFFDSVNEINVNNFDI